MDCLECQQLISSFMDNELDEARAEGVREHLAFCPDCARVCEDFTSILDVCHTEPPSEIVPPNSQALWCRINNLIESEIKPEEPVVEEQQAGRFWRFSFAQLASAVAGIVVISSLLTVVGIRNYMTPRADELGARSGENQTTFEKLMSKVGLAETPQQARERRVKEQQAVIDYWNKRVLERRAQWDARLRDAFDRNLSVIDESVNDYQVILQQDPDDEITGEMLDSALDDKMQLLREFAEL
jgi:hypothetical protein